MNKPTVLGVGTCIIDTILSGLKAMPGAEDKADFHMSQILPEGRATVPEEMLRRCAVLIEERPPWQNQRLLSDVERVLIPADCATIFVPSLHLNSLWPLAAMDPRNISEPDAPWGRIPWTHGDRLAMKIIAEVPDPKARVAAYFAEDPLEFVNVARNHDLEVSNSFRRELDCQVKVAAYIHTHFRKKRLFFMLHHPTVDLYSFVLAQVLAHDNVQEILKLPLYQMIEAAQHWCRISPVLDHSAVPIHPAIADFFQLKWYDRSMKYDWLGQSYTFDEWMEFYLTYSPSGLVT